MIPCMNYYRFGLCWWHSASGKYTRPGWIPAAGSEAGSTSFHVNADKMECMCFNQSDNVSTLNAGSLKLVEKFTHLRSNISSTENDINMWQVKACTAIDRLLIIWKSDQANEIKHNFFKAEVVSILLYGCTTRMLIKHREKDSELY